MINTECYGHRAKTLFATMHTWFISEGNVEKKKVRKKENNEPSATAQSQVSLIT